MFPKTQSILRSKFVEVRLHTDLTSTHPNYKFLERIIEIRDRYLGEGNIGLPQYVIVDPNNPDKQLAKKFGGAGGVPAFLEFFQRALAKAHG